MQDMARILMLCVVILVGFAAENHAQQGGWPPIPDDRATGVEPSESARAPISRVGRTDKGFANHPCRS